MPTTPLAFFITFSCYGARLHGEEKGSVDRLHNEPGSRFLEMDPHRIALDAERMDQPPYTLDDPRREIVLRTICEVCDYRNWTLFAAHVRTNHVHVVAYLDAAPEKAMNDLKAYCSRKLNEAGVDKPHRKRWARHGSTRYLWDEEAVSGAIWYTVHGQGEPMAVHPPDVCTPLPNGRGSE